jgi:hypothetical protein
MSKSTDACWVFLYATASCFYKALVSSTSPWGMKTTLTFVFSFVPDVGPTPSLRHHSHLGQQISRTDEGAEFPTRKKLKGK